jgi:acetolactate synthase-1/2/3 large subunit
MTGAEAIAHCLARQGIELVFGMRGLHITPVATALKRLGIRFIEARHEQSAAFMADAYARVTGKVGVVIAGTGAGTACTLVGIQEAYGSSSPVLLIASQIDQAHRGKRWGDLHEVKDQHGLISSAAEACYDIAHVTEIPGTIHAICRRMLNERPRPYGLEVPVDVLNSRLASRVSYEPATRRPVTPDGQRLGEAVRAISRAARPVIYAGGGAVASGAAPLVRALADRLSAPVLTSVKGKGVISEADPLALGNLGTEPPVRRLLQASDLAIVIGTRFSNRSTGAWSLRLPPRWVRIDIDPRQFTTTHPDVQAAEVIELVGDAGATLEAMLEGLAREPFRGLGFDRAAVIRAKREVFEALRRWYPAEVQLLEDLRKALGSEAIVANDSTIASYWTRRYFEVRSPRSFLWAMGSGTIGFGLPAAIAARIAEPGRQAVAICGDGGFLFSCHDLATAVKARVAVAVLLFNDQAYGIVDYAQRKIDPGIGEERLANPDFLALARSFGAEATKVASLDQVGAVLADACSRDRLAVIEVPVSLQVPPDLA